MKQIYEWSQDLGFLVAGVVLGVFVLAYFSANDIYDYRDSVKQADLAVDAVVCLAGGRGRIAAAEELWSSYYEKQQHGHGPVLPVLYLSGMGVQATWSGVFKQFRVKTQKTIRAQDVVIEKQSSNTEENAKWFAEYAAQNGWKHVVLVTSSYHMKRAELIFKTVLNSRKIPLRMETHSVYQEPFVSEAWKRDFVGIRVSVLEYLKWIYYQTFWRL